MSRRTSRPSPPNKNKHNTKKPRHSERLSQRQDHVEPHKTPITTKQQLPSPLTHLTTEDTSSDLFKEATATPPAGRPSEFPHRADLQSLGFSSPPQDTQAVSSQYFDPNAALSDEVEYEVKEGVWGYLFPLYTRYGGRCVVLRRRAACPLPDAVVEATPDKNKKATGKRALGGEGGGGEADKVTGSGLPSGGYLIGRHPECGKSRQPPPPCR